MITQLSLLPDMPDNDVEPSCRRPSVPLVKFIAGHWCWREIGSDLYAPEPELEQVLLAALERQQKRKKAA